MLFYFWAVTFLKKLPDAGRAGKGAEFSGQITCLVAATCAFVLSREISCHTGDGGVWFFFPVSI